MATQRIKIVVPILAAVLLLAGLVGYLVGRNSDTQIVVNRREEVVIDEGINNAEVAARTRSSLVMVYSQTDAATGVIVTSDGVVALPSAALGMAGKLSAVLGDGRVAAATYLKEDPFTGLTFLQIEERDLPVARQGFAREARAGERVLAIGASSIPRSAEVSAALVTAPAYPVPSREQAHDLRRPNAYLHLDPALSVAALGRVIVNRDGAVIGLITQVDRNLVVIRAEDLELAIDRLLIAGKTYNFNAVYNILSPSLAEMAGLPQKYGAFIRSATHVLLPGDFVLAVDSAELSDRDGFQELLFLKKPSETVKLKLLRAGQEMEVEVIL